jgi:hypothetical protein
MSWHLEFVLYAIVLPQFFDQRWVKSFSLHYSSLEGDGMIDYFSLSIMFRGEFATKPLVANGVSRIKFWYDHE